VRARPLIALAIAGAALVAAPAQAGTSHKKTVKVLDNFFQPHKLTVKAGTTIVWRWPDDGGDVHDVKLRKGPKHVKKFQSDPGSSGYVYRRKLRKPGTYRIVCTFHDEMRMTIRVKKRR
jgi:plastocyanin